MSQQPPPGIGYPQATAPARIRTIVPAEPAGPKPAPGPPPPARRTGTGRSAWMWQPAHGSVHVAATTTIRPGTRVTQTVRCDARGRLTLPGGAGRRYLPARDEPGDTRGSYVVPVFRGAACSARMVVDSGSREDPLTSRAPDPPISGTQWVCRVKVAAPALLVQCLLDRSHGGREREAAPHRPSYATWSRTLSLLS